MPTVNVKVNVKKKRVYDMYTLTPAKCLILTLLTHAVVVTLVVEASVVRLALVLSEVTAGACGS